MNDCANLLFLIQRNKLFKTEIKSNQEGSIIKSHGLRQASSFNSKSCSNNLQGAKSNKVTRKCDPDINNILLCIMLVSAGC